MITLLQTLVQVAERSRIVAETDPHGIIISMVSIAAVFLSLLILFLAYLLIGWTIRTFELRKAVDMPRKGTAEQQRAFNERCDTITIKRKPKTYLTVKEDISGLCRTWSLSEETTATGSFSEPGITRAPLPGMVTGIKVKIGDKVSAGTWLLTLEAMKMENAIESEYDGTVEDIFVAIGDSVLEGVPLIRIR